MSSFSFALSTALFRPSIIVSFSGLKPVEQSDYVLTDDKAPVELLGMRVLDDMILEEISYVKKAIEGKSLRELIKMLFSGELF